MSARVVSLLSVATSLYACVLATEAPDLVLGPLVRFFAGSALLFSIVVALFTWGRSR